MTTIVTRAEWGAASPASVTPLRRFDGWFIHWLGNAYPPDMSDAHALQAVQRFHMRTRGWRDIAYSFAIGREHPDRVYELRGAGVAGGHTEGHNSTSMAIVFLLGEGETPTPAMLATCRQFIDDMAARGFVPRWTRPHNAAKSTACPGPELTAWVNAGLPTTLKENDMADRTDLIAQWQRAILAHGADLGTTGPDRDGIDGDFGPATLAASIAVLDNLVAKVTALVDSERSVVEMLGERQVALEAARADLDAMRRQPATETLDALRPLIEQAASLLEGRP